MSEDESTKKRNIQKNSQLLNEGNKMIEKIHNILQNHQVKINEAKDQQESMNQHKQTTFE